MEIGIYIAASICVLMIVGFVVWKKSKKSELIESVHNANTQVKESSGTVETKAQCAVQCVQVPDGTIDSSCEFEIVDENGRAVIKATELSEMPSRAYNIVSSESAINRVQHMAADLFKGFVGTPNKTVSVVFKPEIQKGLSNGAYTLLRTNSGEILLDAVDSSGKIVGKGRMIQGGRASQLAAGAFQLVSIAVAQSHLNDIEKSLTDIKTSLTEIIDRQENEDKSKITGAYDYLFEIAMFMKELRCPEELSQQKRNVIESLIKDSYAWRNKLEEDAHSLIRQIGELKDLDTFGTGSTYEQLKVLMGKFEPLLNRRKLLLNFCTAINFVTAYINPSHLEFSKAKPNEGEWQKIVKEFSEVTKVKVSVLLSKSVWNSSETLELRKDKIQSISANCERAANDLQQLFAKTQKELAMSLNSFISRDGSVQVAMSFDSAGQVKQFAIL